MSHSFRVSSKLTPSPTACPAYICEIKLFSLHKIHRGCFYLYLEINASIEAPPADEDEDEDDGGLLLGIDWFSFCSLSVFVCFGSKI